MVGVGISGIHRESGRGQGAAPEGRHPGGFGSAEGLVRVTEGTQFMREGLSVANITG